tara:strand:+ start:673 stop:1092 length:420 start_codon:yes stop_codon:yes gene_type:complete
MEFDQKNILFHHTGVITDDIESSISFFSKLGYTTSNIYNDKPQQTFVAILNKTNSPMIELVSPMNSNSPAQGWVTRVGAGAYHICFKIENAKLNEAIDYFKMQKFSQLSEPTLSPAFDGAHVVFLWGKEAGLIELVGSL